MATGTSVLYHDRFVPKAVDSCVKALGHEVRLEQLLKDIMVGHSKPGFRIPKDKDGTAINFRQTRSKEARTHYFGQAWACRFNLM
jgi:hypothetical protein